MGEDFERPILSVDVPLFTLRDGRLVVALQRRDRPPYEGELALIGGYVHVDEDQDTLATAKRVLKSKAGLEGIFLEQLMTFSGPTRDPRGWSASVAYYALVPETLLAPLERRRIELVPVEKARKLPFEHHVVVSSGVERLRTKGSYSSLPAFLLPRMFTLPQLRAVYEAVLGERLNDSAFRRKIDELDILEPIKGQFSKESARPAQLYRLKRTTLKEFDRTL